MAGDVLDDLLDYNTNDNDIFKDIDISIDIPSRRKPSPNAESTKNISGLGIDEEIQVKKKRKPTVKLDEHRLLAPAGIPKLRRIANERLRFKGKGHEYSDTARLLSTYQLWLDALYPRAKFADGLAIIEKLGHTKRMQTMRREWINEKKVQDNSDAGLGHAENSAPAQQKRIDSPERPSTPSNNQHHRVSPAPNEANDHDLYSATPRKPHVWPPKDDHKDSLFLSDLESTSLTSEDGLDALFAEDTNNGNSLNSGVGTRVMMLQGGGVERQDADFDDEMEAMAGMD